MAFQLSYTGSQVDSAIQDVLDGFGDNEKAEFGDGQNAGIYYDGTDLIVDPHQSGDGALTIPTGTAPEVHFSVDPSGEIGDLTRWRLTTNRSNNAGSSRDNYIFQWGYNPNQYNRDGTEMGVYQSIETFYAPNATDQYAEHHFVYQSPDATSGNSFRWITSKFEKDTEEIDTSMVCDFLRIKRRSDSSPMFQIKVADGDMFIGEGGRLTYHYDNNNEEWLRQKNSSGNFVNFMYLDDSDRWVWDDGSPVMRADGTYGLTIYGESGSPLRLRRENSNGTEIQDFDITLTDANIYFRDENDDKFIYHYPGTGMDEFLVLRSQTMSVGVGASGTEISYSAHIGSDGLRHDGLPDFQGGNSTSASAGSNGDVPSQVDGYINVEVNGLAKRVPYYNT